MAKGLDNIMREVDVDGDGQVTIREFARMLRKYKHMMAPAFDLWDKLSELSQPCTAMYREIKAAGNVQKLIDLAMMQSEERAAKGGRFEDVGTRSDPRASSPRGCRCFARARSEANAKTWRFEPPTNATRKDTSIPTPAEGISIVAKRRDRCRRPRVETKGRDEFAATRATRDARATTATRDAFGRSPPTPPPPKTAEELEMERAFAAFDAEEDEPAEDANRRGDGGRREYEPAVGGYARAEDGGDGNAETETSLTETWRRNVVDTIGVSRATSLSSRALAPSIVSLTARFVSGLGTRTRSFPRRHTRRVRPRSTSPIAAPRASPSFPFGTRRRSVRPSVP